MWILFELTVSWLGGVNSYLIIEGVECGEWVGFGSGDLLGVLGFGEKVRDC